MTFPKYPTSERNEWDLKEEGKCLYKITQNTRQICYNVGVKPKEM